MKSEAHRWPRRRDRQRLSAYLSATARRVSQGHTSWYDRSGATNRRYASQRLERSRQRCWDRV